MSKQTVPASAVVSYFRSNEKALGLLSEKTQTTIRNEKRRGQLPAEAIAVFNKRHRTKEYAKGATGTLTAAAKAEAQAQREALRSQGVAVGARGPLPKVKPESSTPKA